MKPLALDTAPLQVRVLAAVVASHRVRGTGPTQSELAKLLNSDTVQEAVQALRWRGLIESSQPFHTRGGYRPARTIAATGAGHAWIDHATGEFRVAPPEELEAFRRTWPERGRC